MAESGRTAAGTLRHVTEVFHQQNCPEHRIQERIDGIRQAVPATTDKAVLQAEAMAARGFLAVMAILRANIVELDEQIAKAFAAQPENALWSCLRSRDGVL